MLMRLHQGTVMHEIGNGVTRTALYYAPPEA